MGTNYVQYEMARLAELRFYFYINKFCSFQTPVEWFQMCKLL